MATMTYATRVLNNYSNAASVYYDRMPGEATPGTGNLFVIADHNDDQVIIQASRRFADQVCYTFPRDSLYDARTHETVAVTKYGQSGGCVLIGSDLHCYVPVQVKRGSSTPTELWHIVISNIVIF